MKSLLLSLLLAPCLALAADDAKPKKGGKAGERGRPAPGAAFKKMDTSADGSLSLDEFKAGPAGKKNPARAETAFKKMDKDGDGKLTPAEFKARTVKKAGKPGKAKPAEQPKTEAPKTEKRKTEEPKAGS